jgi:two-component system cell cycle response regulator DivK
MGVQSMGSKACVLQNSSAGGGKMKPGAARILVVDDNPTNLKLVSDVLECEGFEILKSVDAEEAERIIEHHRPELVLIDIALPGMDGLMLTRKLKAEDKTKNLIIVALTAFAMRGDEQKAREAGCDGYITKPIDTRALPGLVAGYLQRLKPKACNAYLGKAFRPSQANETLPRNDP